MPHLHQQMVGQAEATDGKNFLIHPQIALTQRGPCVQIAVSIAQPVAEQLLQRGETLPNMVSGVGLIDTGASSTCVDIDMVTSLGIQPTDFVMVASASHEETKQGVYPITFQIVGLPIGINALRSIGAPLKAQGIQLLIGRDVLQHCTLFYNGIVGQFTLSI